MSRRVSPAALILFLFALSLTFFATQSSDVLMYLALARDFIFGPLRGDLDPYLYARTAATLTWTHEWLSYALYYGAWQLGGAAGLILFKMLVLSVTFAMILGRGRNLSPLWAGLWIVGITAASFRFIERGSAFSDLFLVLLARWLLEAPRVSRALLIKLTVLFTLWAQLHPAYPLGLAMLGLWILNRRQWTPWLALPALAPLLNPDGWRGYIYPLTFALNEGRVFKLYNLEWFPTYHPAFRFAPESLAFWIMALVLVALVIRARQPRELRAWFIGFGLVVGATAVRFVPVASFLGLLCVKPWARLDYVRVPRWASALGLVLVVALSVKNFAFGYVSSSGPRRPKLALDPAFFPDQTLEIYRQHRIPGRLYNSHDFGASLIWNQMTPVFHHGFVTDVQFYRDEVIGAMRSPAEFFALADKYQWTMLLIEKRNAYRTFHAFLKDRPEWKIVGEDEAAYLIFKLPD